MILLAVVSALFLVLRSSATHVAIESAKIVDAMNAARARVSDGSNLQKLEWNAELAAVAQSHSDKCSLTENTARETSSYVSSEIGENINVTANLVNPHTYIHNVITYWESLGDLYEYETNVLSDIEARLYTQLVWCSSSQVGCGVSECNIGNVEYHFMVCDFQPSGNDYGERPYSRGVPCSNCPSDKPLCNDNLCVADPSTMVGSEPHFSVQLSSGQMLCFSIHGQTGTSINLISSNDLEVNAVFVDHDHSHDSLGAIEFLRGNRRLVINATSSKVCIDGQVKVDFKRVQKVTMVNDKLSLMMLDESMHPSNEVDVIIDDLSFSFTITNYHIDVMMSNRGQSQHFHGLLGGFLQPGVSIDESKKELKLPDRHDSLHIEQQPLSSFIHTRSSQYKEAHCWTTVKKVEGSVEGVYMDYDVGNIFSAAEFMFGTANLSQS